MVRQGHIIIILQRSSRFSAGSMRVAKPLLSGIAILLLSAAINCSLASADSSSNSDRELLPYEPLQYIKTVSPPVSDDSVWREFVELSAQEVGQLTADMKAKLKAHLAKTGTSAVFAKGERVLTQRRSSKLKWDSTVELPFSNTLSLLSVILPILLENYKHSVIANPIGEVLKGSDLDNPLVSGHKSKSFLDLLNKLPKSGASLDLGSNALLDELNTNGKLAVHFANAILGESVREAWLDALLAIGMEDMKLSQNGHLEMNLNRLLQYALTVLHDYRILGVVPKSEIIPPDGNHFLFGWWQNCPKTKSGTSECLLQELPEDAIFSLSPSVRIYVSPSLELLMIILGPDATPATASGQYPNKRDLKSVNDILQEDAAIWGQISSSISGAESDQGASSSNDDDGFSQSDASEQEREKKDEQKAKESGTKQSESEEAPSEEGEQAPVEDPDQSELAKWIHWVWPMIVFLFWVTISHVWVYWLFHCGWFIMKKVSKRGYAPRPKTAADAGQN